MVLLRMDEGLYPNKAAAAIGVTPETARMWGWRYVKEGLDAALFDRLRPGNPPLLNNKQATHIIAIACSPPPDGVAFWSTAMLAEEAIKRKIVKSISRETVRVLLKNHDLKPWREKNVVRERTLARIHQANGRSPESLRKASESA